MYRPSLHSSKSDQSHESSPTQSLNRKSPKGVQSNSLSSLLLQLQQTAGNQAVISMLNHSISSVPATKNKSSILPSSELRKEESEQGSIRMQPGSIVETNNNALIQLAKGKLYDISVPSSKRKTITSSFVVYSTTNHGPYEVRNIENIPVELLVHEKKIEYTNMGDQTVVVTKIDGIEIDTSGYEHKKKQKVEHEESPIDTDYTVDNNLGLESTAKLSGKKRPWLKGSNFKLDFGDDHVVNVGGDTIHESLHDEAPKSKYGFRGNSVTLSWELYYENTSKEMKVEQLNLSTFSTFKSADFHQYTNEDLNDMYSLGRVITNNQKYTDEDSTGVAAAKYHSERDFVVQANKGDLVKSLRKSIKKILAKEDIPKLLMIHLHSHTLRICDDCYQFLEAFMNGDWIGELKGNLTNSDDLEVKMLTSADETHPALSGKVDEEYEDGTTFSLSELPKILNMDKYPRG